MNGGLVREEAPMSHAQQTVTVDRPIAEVFAFLADGLNNQKWRPEITEMKLISPGETGAASGNDSGTGLGAEYAVSMKGVGGLAVHGDYRITRYEEPTRLDFEVSQGAARPHGSYVLTELTPASTEVSFILDNKATGLMWVTTPIISAELKTEAERILNLPGALS
ncbi:MAG: hypothetical protein JWQ64_338 [Subtercola sp.]|nr:hypothetical protein [Subtercola sp.]